MNATSLKHFFDPLRVFTTFNILGDILIISSGVGFGNPIRAVSASLGLATQVVGSILGAHKTILNIKIPDFVMGSIFICGFLYIISGSNVFGFEGVPRLAEMAGGLVLMVATSLNLIKKSRLSAVVFLFVTPCFAFSAFEVMWRTGELDYYVLLASICFVIGNISAAWINNDKKVTR